MALQPMQKAKIRLYLGFPDQWRMRNTRLESVMDNVSPEAETQILDVLTSLETVEAKLLGSALPSGGLKRVDEIWFWSPNSTEVGVKSIGKTYVNRLSIILGVPPYSDFFGKAGYLGDTFLPGFGQGGGGGGGSIPLG